MEGMGSVMTSSPTSPTSGRPSSLHASTFAPSARACSSPRWTGSVGAPPTNAGGRGGGGPAPTRGGETGVPRGGEKTQVPPPPGPPPQANPGGGGGEPVEP